MRAFLTVFAIGLIASLLGSPAASQSRDWNDLLAKQMKDWSRTGSGKSPWRMTTDNTLVCSTVPDQYVAEREFRNGTLKLEYRFRRTGSTTGFAAALYVRRTIDGDGVRIDLGDKCGTITAKFNGASDRDKAVSLKPTETLARPIGDWNTIEIGLDGRSVTLRINDKKALTYDQSDAEAPLIALSAEGSEIEFRRVYWKDAR